MLLDDIELKDRLESPSNLINRLQSLTSNSNDKVEIIGVPKDKPSFDDIMPDGDDKLGIVTSKSKALSVMSRCLSRLEQFTPELSPNKLASVIRDMSQVVKNMEPAVANNSEARVQVMIYTPQLRNESEFETIEARD